MSAEQLPSAVQHQHTARRIKIGTADFRVRGWITRSRLPPAEIGQLSRTARAISQVCLPAERSWVVGNPDAVRINPAVCAFVGQLPDLLVTRLHLRSAAAENGALSRPAGTPETTARLLHATRSCPLLQHPFDILGEDIELEVHQISSVQRIEVRVAFRVGDDPYCERVRTDLRDREADPVYCDRAFAGYIMCKLAGQFDLQSEICAFSVERDDCRRAIDMALNEMSAETPFGT